jgi:glycosyltransferase involved in cell wall biosynthesis
MTATAERVAFARLLTATFASRVSVAARTAFAVRRAPPPREGPMRVLMVASQPLSHAGTRHRLSIWADRLRREGHEVDVSLPVPGDVGERLFMSAEYADRAEQHLRTLRSRRAMVRTASRFDVAVIRMTDLPYWEYGPPFVAEALTKTAGRVVLDLDDLPVVRGERAPGPRARRLASLVDGLILGNRELASWFPGRPAWFVPTCIEPALWPPVERSADGRPPMLGWIGTAGGLPLLEDLAPVLAAACAKHGARVRVVCDVPPKMPGVPVDFVPWSGGRETADLADVDVGLAPLIDGPTQRCKCGLKALEHAASCAPVVASPVGALSEIVVHGETGFLAASHEEWAAAIDRLLTDGALRRSMGRAARAAVEARWSYDVHASEFEAALRGTPSVASDPSVGVGIRI